MAAIDMSRQSAGAGGLLPPEISSEIWSNAVQASVVMQASRQISLPGGGLTIPIITGDPEADWVAETDEKPVDDSTLTSKSMTPYKVAVIETFSNEFRRDLPALYAELASRLPYAIGRKFDQTVLFGPAPGTGFDVLTSAPSIALDGTLEPFNKALTDVAVANGNLSHWLVSPVAEGSLRSVKDGQGNYAFLPNPSSSNGQIGSVYGRPVLSSTAVSSSDVVGFGGDFSAGAIYGVTEGIQVAMTDLATVNKGGTQLNLWQRNMFAIRAEATVGFIIRDASRFVKLTKAASGE
jgi:HK97 family phage major capsid protein